MDGWNGTKAGRRSSCRSVQEIIPTEYKCKAGNTCAAAPPVQTAVFRLSLAAAATVRPAGCPAAATVTGKVICQRMN